MIDEGAMPRDLRDQYGSWRDGVDVENLQIIDLYGSLLQGQYAGMTDSLDLGAVEVAMRMAGIPYEEQFEMAARLTVLHSTVREIQRVEERKRG